MWISRDYTGTWLSEEEPEWSEHHAEWTFDVGDYAEVRMWGDSDEDSFCEEGEKRELK